MGPHQLPQFRSDQKQWDYTQNGVKGYFLSDLQSWAVNLPAPQDDAVVFLTGFEEEYETQPALYNYTASSL